IVKKSGITPVVCINSFYTDTQDEINLIKKISEEAGAIATVSEHWLKGSDGTMEFTDAVIDACEKPNNFKFLYELDMPLSKRIETIARDIYGADDVMYLPEAQVKLIKMEKDPEISRMGICMVKTHLSLSHDPTLKCVPEGWTLPVRDILIYSGAGFVVPVAGTISLLPGTASDPAYRRIDVDVKRRKVIGVF
ncbi:MAG: formate--tetrahydrofolate ligase, partial [Spirochaetes bacterium]|nr:formate--tetrahydrofolate ligase [Spirochaetota bacterium]